MKLTVKKIGIIMIFFFIIQSAFGIANAQASVFTNKKEEQKKEISPQVTHIQQKYQPSNSINEFVNILDINLSNPYTKVGIGMPNPINTLKTTTALAKENTYGGHQVVGAINAAFFLGNGMPANLLAQNNEIINYGILGDSTESPTQSPVAFGISKSGNAIIDYYSTKLTFKINGKSYVIDLIDNERKTGKTVLYTPAQKTTGTNQWGLEIVVEGASQNTNELHFGDNFTGTVVSSGVYGQLGNSAIPKDGFVISIQSKEIANAIGPISPGDEVEVSLQIDEKWMDAEFILAAGPLLVKGGAVNISMPTNSQFASSRQPRTVVAVDATGKRLFLVTVDGRQSGHSNGASLKDVASYLISMGASAALNLDGGGSTTMVVRNPGAYYPRIVNKPSDGSERRVSAILQVINTAPKGKLKAINLTSSSAQVVKDSTLEMKVASAYDEYLNPVTIDPLKMTWRVEGNIGKMDGAVFTATAKGEGKIIGEYEGIRTTLAVKVIGVNDFEILSSFDNASNWSVNVAKAKASIANSTSTEPFRQGTKSLKLSYDFTTSDTGTKAVYVVPNAAIPILGRPNEIGMWVYGDSGKQWLRGNIIDGVGQKHTIDFTAQGGLDWTGWKYVTAPMPSSAVGPFKLERIYIAQPTATLQNKGQIYFDKLQAVYRKGYVEPIYTDVAQNHWAASSIRILNEQSLIKGYADGTFKPEKSITRAEAATIIARALNLQASNTISYTDVKPSHYAASAIAAVSEKGIMNGRSEGKFSPDGLLTRAEMAKVLTLAYSLEGTAKVSFSDITTSHWGYKYIETLVANKLTSGFPDNTFRPNDQITRAQFASFLERCLSL